MKEEIKKFIRARITTFRMQRHISENKMSRELGFDASYLQKISSGKATPSLDTLLEIIEYFEMTPAEFFDEKIEQPILVQKVTDSAKEMNEDELTLILAMMEQLKKNKEK